MTRNGRKRKMAAKLDTSKPYGKAFHGPNSYYCQGDKIFDMRTLEEVVPDKPAIVIPPTEPKPATPENKPKKKERE